MICRLDFQSQTYVTAQNDRTLAENAQKNKSCLPKQEVQIESQIEEDTQFGISN